MFSLSRMKFCGSRKVLNPMTVQRSIVTSPIYKLNPQARGFNLKDMVERDIARVRELYGNRPKPSPRNDTVVSSPTVPYTAVSISHGVGSSATACGLQH